MFSPEASSLSTTRGRVSEGESGLLGCFGQCGKTSEYRAVAKPEKSWDQWMLLPQTGLAARVFHHNFGL